MKGDKIGTFCFGDGMQFLVAEDRNYFEGTSGSLLFNKRLIQTYTEGVK